MYPNTLSKKAESTFASNSTNSRVVSRIWSWGRECAFKPRQLNQIVYIFPSFSMKNYTLTRKIRGNSERSNFNTHILLDVLIGTFLCANGSMLVESSSCQLAQLPLLNATPHVAKASKGDVGEIVPLRGTSFLCLSRISSVYYLFKRQNRTVVFSPICVWSFLNLSCRIFTVVYI